MADQPEYILNRFARNVFSQTGEDGIIERILAVIKVNDGWCVEFGAWDGLLFSNCANLVRNRDYSGVFIEADPLRLRQLVANYKGYPKVRAMNAFVGYGAADNLDALLRGVPIPTNFDILSIDVDGNDYHVWEAVSQVRPKIVCIEFNPTIPNEIDFVQPRDPRVQQGCSLMALVRLAAAKRYKLLCATSWNGLFVDEQYFDMFSIPDNSIANLRRDLSLITHMFTGYDGRVILSGYKRLHWHALPMDEKRFQQLPSILFGYPDRYSSFQRFIFTCYKKWRRGLSRLGYPSRRRRF